MGTVMKPHRDRQTSELTYYFPDDVPVEILDRQDKGRIRPEGMKLVDFVVEQPSGVTLLIEQKDLSAHAVPAQEHAVFQQQLEHDTWIKHSLVPKARDSYAFLHLMLRDNCEFDYIVVIGSERVSLDSALLSSFHARLVNNLRQETSDGPWRRRYLRRVKVVKSEEWQAVRDRESGYCESKLLREVVN
jgi:hypothetical protein